MWRTLVPSERAPTGCSCVRDRIVRRTVFISNVAKAAPRQRLGTYPEQHHRATDVCDTRQRFAQSAEALRILGADHGAEDHLQRNAPHGVHQLKWSARRPAVDLGVCRGLDDVAVVAHAVAVEGGQHPAPLCDVLLAVDQQHRTRAHDRLQDRVGFARAKDFRVARENRLDVLGIGEEDPRAGREGAHGEGVAVAPVARAQVVVSVTPVQIRLDRNGQPRAGREAGFALDCGAGVRRLGAHPDRCPSLKLSCTAA
jgi:hypothetical protein